jgi:large conductance mechanosensitive channel
MLKEFREFVFRGNVLELAVAVVLAAAFGAVVASLVADVLTPIIAAVVGEPDFSGLTIPLGESEIRYGAFLNTVFALLVVAAALFFFVIKPVNAIIERTTRGAAPTTKACPECLSTIPAAARRCANCTAQLAV